MFYRLLFRVILILAKIGKFTFPKYFFNEFWLIVREHEIHLTEHEIHLTLLK